MPVTCPVASWHTQNTRGSERSRLQDGFVLQKELSEYEACQGMLLSAGSCCLDSSRRARKYFICPQLCFSL